MTKEIENIVFYKENKTNDPKAKACIFYKDGTVNYISVEEGKKEVYEFAKQKNYKTINELEQCQNIHFLTKLEFMKRWNEFRVIKKEEENSKSEKQISSQKKSTPYFDLRDLDTKEENTKTKEMINLSEEEKEETKNKNKINNADIDDIDEFDNEREIGIIKHFKEKIKNKKEQKKNNDKTTTKKQNIFKKIKKRTVALITAAALLVTSTVGASVAFYNKFKAKKDTKKFPVTVEKNTNTLTPENMTNEDIVRLAQKDYNFSELRQLTKNKTQINEMTKVGMYLDLFNGTFANKIKEENSNIKPALKWNEVMALNLAYNNFTPDEIRAMYNGSTINVNNYDAYYKDATNQLIAAYIIEEKDAPINLDKMINSKEGKDFYNKYHNLYLKAKTSTGQEQINAVNKFYKELKKDFQFTENARYNGISHAEERSDIKPYMLSVAPMVQASEMLFQNLAIDHTLSDKAYDYFNDNGLCNLAKEHFESARLATYTAEKDDTNPTYNQYKKAKISELKANDWYNIKDKNRDISQLSRFQKLVNAKFEFDKAGNFTGSYTYTTKTSSSSKTVKKTTYKHEKITTKTSSKKEAIKQAGKKKVENAKKEVDNEIAKENAENKEKAQANANKNQQQIQKEANKEAESVKQEVANSNEDMSNKINDANNTINNNNKDNDTSNDTKVNEDDFKDHNVDFDDNYSDSQGNLDDSVKDITTDDTDVNQDFPDPNKSGKAFDNNVSTFSKEEIASQLVEYMAEYPTETYENTTSYQYKK